VIDPEFLKLPQPLRTKVISYLNNPMYVLESTQEQKEARCKFLALVVCLPGFVCLSQIRKKWVLTQLTQGRFYSSTFESWLANYGPGKEKDICLLSPVFQSKLLLQLMVSPFDNADCLDATDQRDFKNLYSNIDQKITDGYEDQIYTLRGQINCLRYILPEHLKKFTDKFIITTKHNQFSDESVFFTIEDISVNQWTLSSLLMKTFFNRYFKSYPNMFQFFKTCMLNEAPWLVQNKDNDDDMILFASHFFLNYLCRRTTNLDQREVIPQLYSFFDTLMRAKPIHSEILNSDTMLPKSQSLTFVFNEQEQLLLSGFSELQKRWLEQMIREECWTKEKILNDIKRLKKIKGFFILPENQITDILHGLMLYKKNTQAHERILKILEWAIPACMEPEQESIFINPLMMHRFILALLENTQRGEKFRQEASVAYVQRFGSFEIPTKLTDLSMYTNQTLARKHFIEVCKKYIIE